MARKTGVIITGVRHMRIIIRISVREGGRRRAVSLAKEAFTKNISRYLTGLVGEGLYIDASDPMAAACRGECL